MGIDHFAGLRRLREDPAASTKLVAGSVLLLSAALIPFLGQIAMRGWTALIARRLATSMEAPLPRLELELDLVGKLFGTGFKGFLVAALWSFGLVFLLAPFVAVTAVGVVFGALRSDDPTLAIVVGAFALPILAVAVIALSVPAQIAALRAEIADDFGPGLDVRGVLDASRRVFKEAFVATIVPGLLQALALPVAVLCCYLPVFPVIVAMMVAHAYVGAQLHRLSIERGASPVPIAVTELPRAGVG